MSANTWIGAANAGQLMDAVRFHAVDVLVVTEATPAIMRRLDAEGASDYFTHREGIARASTFTGTMILSRYPLSVRDPGTDTAVEATQSVQPEVDVTAPEGTVRLKVAHPTAPLPGDTAQWRAGLRALQAWKEHLDGDQLVVLAGDFNASFGHPGFRDLAEGLDDAQRTDGQGWVRTWPFAGNRLPPFVQLDHLLSRRLTVVAAGQVAFNRADHAAVWAERPPADRADATTPEQRPTPGQRPPGRVTRDGRSRRRAGRCPRRVQPLPVRVHAASVPCSTSSATAATQPVDVLGGVAEADADPDRRGRRSPHGSSSSSSTRMWAQNLPSRTPMPCSADRTAETSEESKPSTVNATTATRSWSSPKID